ncbi:MAG: aspartate aminotransferase family protein [Bryobacteraceae bacterium]|nr:aspartate aminotransferase family protein [Bryobacteraceae bacterium]
MSSLAETQPEVSRRVEIMELERDYLLQNYSRYPVVLQRGKGAYVWDTDGKKYLDFITGIGVNALGHAHPRITKVVREQAAKLIHTSNLYYHEFQGPLAQRLAKTSGLQRSFFCNSGTEATEAAMKMLRSHGSHINPEKYEIISLENSFHGRTFGALSITGQHKYRKDFEPLLPGVRFVHANDITALESVFSERTAGILVEGIQGEGGINQISTEFVRKARELCDRYDALYVADEIQCGVGRPGAYYSYQLLDPVIMPDIMIAAKPLGCGVPLGCVVANERAAKSIAPGMHGSTFGGNPIACRIALEFFDILDELMPSIVETGAYFRMRLQEMAKKFTFIKEVRGAGLMVGVELTTPGKQIVLDAMAEGLLLNCTHDVVLRFLPPYIIGQREVDQALKILTIALKKFRRGSFLKKHWTRSATLRRVLHWSSNLKR